MPSDIPQRQNVWQVERKISIGIIVSVLSTAGYGVWWTSRTAEEIHMNADRMLKIEQHMETVESHERRISDLETTMHERGGIISEINDRVTRIEENQKSVLAGQDHMNQRLDQIFQPWIPQQHRDGR